MLKKDKGVFKYINTHNQTYELCDEATKDNPELLKYVNQVWRYILALKAVKKCGLNLKYIDNKTKDYGLCKEAIKQDGLAIQYIPKTQLYNSDLDMEAVKQNGLVLDLIDKDLQTVNLCIQAIKNNPNAIKYVRKDLLNLDMCNLAVKLDKSNIAIYHNISLIYYFIFLNLYKSNTGI